MVSSFKWDLPQHFNIAWAICGRHPAAAPTAPSPEDELHVGVDRVALGLVGLGVRREDRVAMHLNIFISGARS